MPSDDDIPAPLRRGVRHLGALLGRVIEEAEGPELFADVERLRRATIAHRREPTNERRHDVLELVEAMDAHRAERVARAFTIYFQLVNLAEEHHRVRALRQRGRGDDPVHDSLAAAVATVRERDGETTLLDLVGRLEISPVLTAHPTEARRRAVVEALWRISALLERLDDPRTSKAGEAETDRRLLEEITTLWRTDPLRAHAPDPLDEVRAALALFDQTLFVATPILYRELDGLLGDGGSGERTPVVRPFVRWGSWIGGDRDGNPNVTPDVTRAAAEIASDHVVRGLETAARRIGRAITVSDGHVPPSEDLAGSLEQDERAFPDFAGRAMRFGEATHRRKLSIVAERLQATRTGRAGAYASPDDLAADLRLVQTRSLRRVPCDSRTASCSTSSGRWRRSGSISWSWRRGSTPAFMPRRFTSSCRMWQTTRRCSTRSMPQRFARKRRRSERVRFWRRSARWPTSSGASATMPAGGTS